MYKNKISIMLVILSILINCLFLTSCSSSYEGPSFTITHYGRETWGNCRELEAVLEDMKKYYGDKMTVNYINLDDENSSKEAEKYNISGTPFVILYNDKNEQVDTFSGFQDKDELTETLKKNGLIN